MTEWVEGKIFYIKKWNKNLFSIVVNAQVNKYKAGQFTKLSILNDDNKRISRAYSFVNTPNYTLHEFLIKEVNDGQLTPLISNLKVGDTINIFNKATGYFIPENVPPSKNLWMLSTGTALGVYLSILNDELVWEKHEKIVLVHGVSKREDLVYQKNITNLNKEYNDRFQYLPIISQETPCENELSGRLTHYLKNQSFSKYTNTILNPSDSQIMLCGNPNMIVDAKKILEGIGFTKCTKDNGNISFERYW
jgi:ferredoxin/flavodoxin---NADP+ reductase